MTPRSGLVAVVAAGSLLLGATGALSAGAAEPGAAPDKTSPPTVPVDATTGPPPGPPTTNPPGPPTSTGPTTTGLPVTTAVPGPPVALSSVVDVGDAKPERFYDVYLATAIADIEAWWTEQYPRLYGAPYEPLAGGIYAGYPERTSPIPACGFSGTTSYQELSDYGAFYCPAGDFMAYDDGEQGVIYQLAEAFSPSVVAVVLAHEWGHAIQFRTGDLDRDVPTIYTEQQADCFSGAWAGRVWKGEVPGLAFGDEDIRSGLVALVAVRDPIGASVLEPGGHGSAFDRIGAFQEGFIGGIDNCRELIDKPLPVLPNEFSGDDLSNGNAEFGYEPGQIMDILARDLSVYWPSQLGVSGATMPAITVRPVTDPRTDHCGSPQRMQSYGAVFCPTTNEVLFDEATGRVLYDDFGDFAVGYVIGLAWAEGAQVALASQLQGETRVLASDCLVGAWVASAIPMFDAGTGPTTTVAVTRQMQVSPGDLDEAVQAAIVIGDLGLGDNLEGAAFEKIAAMRRGVLDGLPTCLAEISGS